MGDHDHKRTNNHTTMQKKKWSDEGDKLRSIVPGSQQEEEFQSSQSVCMTQRFYYTVNLLWISSIFHVRVDVESLARAE